MKFIFFIIITVFLISSLFTAQQSLAEETGTCYGYEMAICMQEVANGMVQPEWCQ